MKIKRIRIEDLEQQILIGIITNTNFLKRIRNKLKKPHLKSDYSNFILKWVFDYFDNYGKAPGKEIRKIYLANKSQVKLEASKLISIFLKTLSKSYEQQKDFNSEYLYDQAVNYIRKRDLELLVNRIGKFLERDKIGIASASLVDFQLVHKETSEIFNPFDFEYIKANFEERDEGIVELPDALGRLLGPLDRSMLVSFTAPEKRGKTWWLIEMAIQSLIQGRKVLFVSFEMSERQVRNRFWHRLTASYRVVEERKRQKKRILIPILDCLKNQQGLCLEYNRPSVYLFKEGRDKPTFDNANKLYKPCTLCLDERGPRSKKFEATFWYEEAKLSMFSENLVKEKAKAIKDIFGDNLRVKCFPAFTANSTDILNVINELEVNEGFLTDVLVDDYLDIHANEGNLLGRENIDAMWKKAKSTAAQKKLLYITADQSAKVTYEKDIKLQDTSEDKRKNAHVDIKVGINFYEENTNDDLERGIQGVRLALLAHRHRIMSRNQILVLQQLVIGQPLLDNAVLYRSKRKKKDSED